MQHTMMPLLAAILASLPFLSNAFYLDPMFSRDVDSAATCGGVANTTTCGIGFPSSFCCPNGSSCTSINNATTVICCPEGQTCDLLQPITCDITQQNATKYPTGEIHSTNLTATLPTCGSACCPLGYDCQRGMCAINNGTSHSPFGAGSGSTPSGSPSASSSSDACPQPVASHTSSAGLVAAGFFPGIVVGLVLALIAFYLRKRRSRPRQKPVRHGSDLGPISRSVSDPIYHPEYGNRTDFLRTTPTRGANMTEITSGDGRSATRRTRARSLFPRSARNSRQSRYPVRPSGQSNGSTETIDVLMPQPAPLLIPEPTSGGLNIRNTTFSGMLEQASGSRPSSAYYAGDHNSRR